jgi:hypothetical protein
MNNLVFDMTSFTPTQRQWWSDCRNANVERRVSLVAAQFGFFLWTASFRDARSGKHICHRFFCSKPSSNEPVALFKTISERHEWMQKQSGAEFG